MDVVALFCDVDKFAVGFEPPLRRHLLSDGRRHRDRPGRVHLSGVMTIEVMTIPVLFHDSNQGTSKHFYVRHVGVHLRAEFPRLVNCNRFVEHIPDALPAPAAFLRTRLAACTGVSFVDSTPLWACHNGRIGGHKVMKVMAGLAARGKTSTGWFYGFKLHLVVNDRGELVDLCFTPGNVDDRKPVDARAARLFGRLFARGLRLITRIKTNMRDRLMPLFDTLLVRKRAIIKTVIDQMKNVGRVEHSRHRSPRNYFADVIAGPVAYTCRDRLPSLNLRPDELQLLDGAAV